MEAFTRLKVTLTSLIIRGAEDSQLLAAQNHMVECYANLEKANTKYLTAALINIGENQEEADYLNQPHQEMTDAQMLSSHILSFGRGRKY